MARVRQVGGVGIIALHLANFVQRGALRHERAAATASRQRPGHATWRPGELVETRFVDRDTGRPVFKSKSHRSWPRPRRSGIPDFDDLRSRAHRRLRPRPARRGRDQPTDRGPRATRIVGVMAQVNSSNYGYNLPIKYIGADYYSLNRTEAELCLHEREPAAGRAASTGRAALLAVRRRVGDRRRARRERRGRRRARSRMPSLSVQRRRHDRLRRCLLRAEQRRRLPSACRRRIVGARRQHRRRRDDAAPLQREPGHGAGVHDHREDRHLMRVLVTGGCGYVGTQADARRCSRARPIDVTVLDTQWFGNYLHAASAARRSCQRRPRHRSRSTSSPFDTIFHLANIANDPAVELNPYASWDVNVLATMRLVDRAARQGVRQFVFASSGAVYGVRSEPRGDRGARPGADLRIQQDEDGRRARDHELRATRW